MDTTFDVVERLHRDFGVQLARAQILAVAQQCRDQLDSVPVAARPELLERLVRQRLTDQVDDQPAEARDDADSGASHSQ